MRPVEVRYRPEASSDWERSGRSDADIEAALAPRGWISGESVPPVRIASGLLIAEEAETQRSQRNSIQSSSVVRLERQHSKVNRRAKRAPIAPAGKDQ
jgi:hypothetical protein